MFSVLDDDGHASFLKTQRPGSGMMLSFFCCRDGFRHVALRPRLYAGVSSLREGGPPSTGINAQGLVTAGQGMVRWRAMARNTSCSIFDDMDDEFDSVREANLTLTRRGISGQCALNNLIAISPTSASVRPTDP